MRSAALFAMVTQAIGSAGAAIAPAPSSHMLTSLLLLIAAAAGFVLGMRRGARGTSEAGRHAAGRLDAGGLDAGNIGRPRTLHPRDALNLRNAAPVPAPLATNTSTERSAARDAATAAVARNTSRDDRAELDDGIGLVCNATSARAGTLWRIDASGETARAVGCHGRALPQPRTLRGDPLGWVAREGTPLRIEPAPSWAGDDVRVVALRLWKRENRGWVLTLEYPRDAGAAAATADLENLDATVAPIRLLVELHERRSETDADRRRLNSLLDILHRIPVATELEPAADELIAACMTLTGATGGAVGLWDGDAGRIVGVRGQDGGPQLGASFASPKSEMALAGRADAILVRSNGAWKPGATNMANETDRWTARPRSFAAIPLSTSSGITAVLAVWSSTNAALDEPGIELISAVAPYAALHLKHASEFGRMRETAETDALTGLRNRRAFDAALQLEASRFDRYGRPLSLLMIDMDHFKAVNDKHGHEAGDEVLRRVAERVRSCVRDVDTAARFGGEELAVLLPETPLAAARDVAERIRITVAGTPVRWGEESIHVTVSIGIACVPESVDKPLALLTKADEALYAAKNSGRNRVC